MGNWTVKRVTFDTNRPNGVLLSADQSVLYVAESPILDNLRRQLRAYPVNSDGTLGDKSVLFDFGAGRGIDGMALTTDGQILAPQAPAQQAPVLRSTSSNQTA